MTGNVRRCTAALATAGLLALPACSDDKADQPRALPPVTASPTASAPVAPTMPAAAKQHTREGAEAFARHFIDAVNYAQQTGKTGMVRSLSAPRCESCAQYVSDVHDWYRDGSVRGGLLTIKGIRAQPLRPGYSPTAVLDVDVSPVEWFDAKGSKVGATEPGYPGQLFLSLAWEKASWRVAEINVKRGSTS
jgi:hypothetical protein